MSQSREFSVQRHKLLDEIRHLADIAVFGTLSETYRTCGRAGCHCQQGGPKHGPHLNISYRGRRARPLATMFRKERRRPPEKVWPHGKSYRHVCGS
jgi:hypothetical protein